MGPLSFSFSIGFHHAVFASMVLKCNLNTGIVKPPAFLFFSSTGVLPLCLVLAMHEYIQVEPCLQPSALLIFLWIVLGSQPILYFIMSSLFVFSVSMKSVIGLLMGITLNLQTDFDNMVVFTILFF
jgi:hypothetical protein